MKLQNNFTTPEQSKRWLELQTKSQAEGNNDVYAERLQLIRDFMMLTERPATELQAFLSAFDGCNPCAVSDVNIVAKDDKQQESTDNKDEATQSVPDKPLKRTRRTKFTQLIHSGTTPNVHPNAKMIASEFEGRIEYYGSITAAAQRLGVTFAQMNYALRHKKLVNGCSVYYVSQEDLFKNNNKEPAKEISEE